MTSKYYNREKNTIKMRKWRETRLYRTPQLLINYQSRVQKYHQTDRHKELVKARGIRRRQEWLDFLGPIACEKCGYNKCKRALSFHHVDPETKLFEVRASTYFLKKKITREQFIAEMNKCICLCMNCHMEVEDTA